MPCAQCPLVPSHLHPQTLFITSCFSRCACATDVILLITPIRRFLHRIFDDSLTFASTGRSSSVLLAEVWSRSLQEQVPDVLASASASSNKSAPSRSTFAAASRPTVTAKSVPIKEIPSLTLETSKLNKDSTCSVAWYAARFFAQFLCLFIGSYSCRFMFSLIRKGMLLHLQRSDLNSDGFAPNSLHPVRKMLVEISFEVRA
jgi:hypothetical protein